MKYYLETNALYNLKNIPPEKLPSCYTSALALIEIIGGANTKNFSKRRAILKNLISSGIDIDWRMPMTVVFDSFSVFDDFHLGDRRAEYLEQALLMSLFMDDYAEFETLEFADSGVNVSCFKEMDLHFSAHFVAIFSILNDMIRTLSQPSNTTFEGIEYFISTPKELKIALGAHPKVRKEMTVNSLSAKLKMQIDSLNNPYGVDVSLEEIVNSYNGKIESFVDVYARYMMSKLDIEELPNKNDHQDLMHLLYISDKETVIVSDDNLYKKYFSHGVISLKEIGALPT